MTGQPPDTHLAQPVAGIYGYTVESLCCADHLDTTVDWVVEKFSEYLASHGQPVLPDTWCWWAVPVTDATPPRFVEQGPPATLHVEQPTPATSAA